VNLSRYLVSVVCLAALFAAGCADAPGRPKTAEEVPRPDSILDFKTLYAQNCSGCHGAEGKGGAAIALNDPVFLPIADDTTIRNIVTNGVKNTSMPAFAQSAGGMLTEKQVDAIVAGIRSNWRPTAITKFFGPVPPYTSPTSGDAQRGAGVYNKFCESCHGANGKGGTKGGSIVDDSFLALVSDQYLRTLVIAGRPELGFPNWQDDVPGTSMSSQEISDVVAWLASHRIATPGQPYATNTNGAH
jgi:cytochrome c oxidase cbb3-type subunit III